MPLVTTQATRWVVDGAYMEIKAGTPVTRPRTIEAACPDPHRCGLVFGAIQQAARNDITLVPVILEGAVRLSWENAIRKATGTRPFVCRPINIGITATARHNLPRSRRRLRLRRRGCGSELH